MDYKTKSWIIGILIGSLIATLIVGLFHENRDFGYDGKPFASFD